MSITLRFLGTSAGAPIPHAGLYVPSVRRGPPRAQAVPDTIGDFA